MLKKNEKVVDVGEKMGKNDQEVVKMAKLANMVAISRSSHSLKVVL